MGMAKMIRETPAKRKLMPTKTPSNQSELAGQFLRTTRPIIMSTAAFRRIQPEWGAERILKKRANSEMPEARNRMARTKVRVRGAMAGWVRIKAPAKMAAVATTNYHTKLAKLSKRKAAMRCPIPAAISSQASKMLRAAVVANGKLMASTPAMTMTIAPRINHVFDRLSISSDK